MQSSKLLIEKYELLLEKRLDEKKKEDFIRKFVKFVGKELGIKDLPKIFLNKKDGFASERKSFGQYHPGEKKLVIAVTNRNLADTLRTLGHELVHCKQHEDGRISLDNAMESGKDGSDIENEANCKAAVLMREFGRQYPEIFE